MQDRAIIARGSGTASQRFTGSESREEMRAFLQQRLGAFGLTLAVVFGMFLTWRVLSALTTDDDPNQTFLPWQASSVAAFIATWLICRGRPRSERLLRIIEGVGLCWAGGTVIMMTLHISYVARPDSILLMCMSYTLIARAIMVPSTARRTLAYGLFFAVPFLIAVFFIHRNHHDPAIYTAAADPRVRVDATTMAIHWTGVAALWWVAGLIITTSTSKVIYGLRREVHDARRLGQYTLLEKLGEGGMGVVYRASHAMLRRPSALKLLPPDKYGDESVARFEREVQLTARLSHPNTIRIYDYGRTPDGIFYYVMEYMEGASLADVIAAGGPLPAGRVIHILDQVAGALTEAHGIGLIHRDIKPANIFLTEQGGVPDVAKVLDFGLVKQLTDSVEPDALGPALTLDNSFTGTPLYMAPESVSAPDRVDARADLYSLGAVGYFLLTGKDVFSGRTVVEVCSHHLHSTPEPPSRRLGAPIPADLEELVLSCLEKAPERRPATARVLQEMLRSCSDAQAWTEADARQWLDLHRGSLRARQARHEIESAATVTVDLRRLYQPASHDQRRVG